MVTGRERNFAKSVKAEHCTAGVLFVCTAKWSGFDFLSGYDLVEPFGCVEAQTFMRPLLSAPIP